MSKAVRLEWLTLAYMVTALVAVFFALGSSQAMKAAWLEDMLSLVPPAAFLIATRYRDRRPTEEMAWGYHRAISVAYLAGSIAIVALGAFVLFDSSHKLIRGEHPAIGLVELWDWHFWQGYLMLAVLLYTGIPPVILGLMKKPLAEKLHDKVLYADAEMQRADWMTAGAAALGVIGIGLGLWWADAVAAALISLDITHDGFSNLRRAVVDLMDQTPTTIDQDDMDPLRDKLASMLQNLDWVEEVEVRLREEGQVYFGEAFVVPSDETNITHNVGEALKRARDLDWRIHDLALTPVRRLPQKGERTG